MAEFKYKCIISINAILETLVFKVFKEETIMCKW